MKYFLAFLCLIKFAMISVVANDDVVLLDDQLELEQYISSFPYENYMIYNVPGQGKFYIEPEINDFLKNILKAGTVCGSYLMPFIAKYGRPGTVILDVGAHIGTMTIPMAEQVGPNGHVFAFEPQKKLFRELTANCFLNGIQDRVTLYRFAVGDTHKLVMMNPASEGNEAGTGLGSGGDFVELRTLDSFSFKNVSLIKIDVEGFEAEVIDGMVNTLRENKPVVIIEIMGGHSWETATPEVRTRIEYVKSKLRSLDYDITLIAGPDYLALPK